MANLVKTEPIYIFACSNPFNMDRKQIQLSDYRLSLYEIIERLQPNEMYRHGAYVAVNSEVILEEDWKYFYPAPRSVINIRVIPKGPVIPIVMALAAIAAQVGTPLAVAAILDITLTATTAAIIGAVAAMVVSVVGYIIMNALVRPPGSTATPKALTAASQRFDDARDTPSSYLTGARNATSPYGVIPRVYGTVRMTPPLAAQSYTELVNVMGVPFEWVGQASGGKYYANQPNYYNLTEQLGEAQYLRLVVCWGFGPVTVKGLRISTTDLSDYSNVEIEHRYGYPEDEKLTLYTEDVYEEALDVSLTRAIGYVSRTTQAHTDEISLDIAFPGLYQTNPQTGQKLQVSVGFVIRYRPVGTDDNAWIYLPVFNCYGTTTSTVRRGFRWKVPSGQYEVAIARGTDDDRSGYIIDKSVWVLLRSIRSTYPVKEKGLALTAMRIRASDQLQGNVDELNGLVTSILRDWDPNSGSWSSRETNNPASIIADILCGNPEYGISANTRFISDDRVDWNSIEVFHGWCTENKFACNYIFDASTTIWDALQLVAACGRATMSVVNGKWGVVIDKEQDFPVQHFTPRNSWDFKATQTFLDEIHGFRIKFANEEEDYADAETTVYMDGYDADNATKFEDLSLQGVTNYDQIYKLARYFLAVGEHRRETVTFSADFEHIICQRGDRIKYSHDVMLIGIVSGRLAGLIDDGVNVTHFILDEVVEMGEGISYNVRFRLSNNTSYLFPVVTIDGMTDTLELTSPVNLSSLTLPEIGDLYTFGEAGTETEDLLVKSIEPGPDLTATIECTLYAPAVFTAAIGPIPPYVPKITVPISWQTPQIDTILSDGSVLIWSQGSWQSRILVDFSYPTFLPLYSGIEGSYRRALSDSSGTWVSVTAALSDSTLSFYPVEDGAVYELRFRYTRQNGTFGPWSSIYTHTVLGKTAPPSDVSGFSASYFAGLVNFKWDKVPDVDVAAYEIRYGEPGGDWEAGTVLVQTLAATSAISVMLPVGTWDILIKAIDVVGNYSDNATVTPVSVLSIYQTVFRQTHENWPGSKTNYVENIMTGHLNPTSSIIATANNFDTFTSYVTSPATTSIYTGATITLGSDDTVRAYGMVRGRLGPGSTGVIAPHVQINYGDGWKDWSIGNVTASYVRFRFVSPASIGLFSVSGFDCYLDKEPILETGDLNVSATGTTVTFMEKFYTSPLLQVSASAGTGSKPRIATSSGLTITYFVAHIHTSNGTAVGGKLTYTATSREAL